VGCVRGGCHHDLFRSVEYGDCKFLEKSSNKTDEEQGQAFALDERIVGEYQKVLRYSIASVVTASLDANHAPPHLASSCMLGSTPSFVGFYLCETKRSSRCSGKLESALCVSVA
jgi:hypothetical protein